MTVGVCFDGREWEFDCLSGACNANVLSKPTLTGMD